jgi:hypothetical protein
MTAGETLVLSDRDTFPDDDLIFSIIGDKKVVWQGIMNYLAVNYSEAAVSWNYYNDGKQWLYKMVRKKKTIFWIGVLPDTFRITFYFGDKAETAVENSDLPQFIKDDFRKTRRFGRIRAISTKITGDADLENIYKLIDLKVKLK